MEEAGEKAEAPAKGVEAIGALQGELPSGSVDEGAGVDNFDPRIDIPLMVDLREKEAVRSSWNGQSAHVAAPRVSSSRPRCSATATMSVFRACSTASGEAMGAF